MRLRPDKGALAGVAVFYLPILPGAGTGSYLKRSDSTMDQKGDQFQAGRGAGPGDIQTNSPGALPPPGSPLATSVGYTPTRNQMILFWASFLTLIAGGVGFAVRAGILLEWGKQFGFTQFDLGNITGAGLWGFPIAIIPLSFIADRVGYKPLMGLAFFFHVASAVVTLAAGPIYTAYGHDAAYQCLYWGTFIFSLGNGACESVINPLTATLFPRAKTHWLNILHAGWPGGLILGALIVLGFDYIGQIPSIGHIPWEVLMAIFLIPTLIYGVMMLPRTFPHSEAKAAGIPFATMLLEFASPILLFLLLLHAMVGYVELGTDSWITNITGTILKNPNYGVMLFIWTSGLMFILRFCAGPIVHKISPLGLLFCSAVLGCCGLTMLGMGPTTGAYVILFYILAATVYGCGKTFFWPTMLGVISERFPKGGALTLGISGGIGMLSAGLLGGPAIGYQQDSFAIQNLRTTDEHAYDRYASETPEKFLFFPEIHGLDNAKLATLNAKPTKEDPKGGSNITEDVNNLQRAGRDPANDKNLQKLKTWWDTEGDPHAEMDKPPVDDARLFGGKMALTWTAVVPAMMAIGYLILILYFWSRGGYQAQVLLEHKANDEQFTGGVEGPADM
jgi:MFS family permease